ncbi:hypothetical protein MKW98_001984 [Papaver atlanticum]|uniref:Uncharacterized protein n=1 Tax=Papaver atlanticum TaxID=357466 RepID=A0AAD4XIX4_9MAGN|nr:hypothetical protein MKW98_001984 [Papaver atlanticum]
MTFHWIVSCINRGKKSPEMSPYGSKDWVFGGFIVHELAEAARAQLEKDRLIFLVEQADEKLSQLLDQIVLMNQFISSPNKVPVSRSG